MKGEEEVEKKMLKLGIEKEIIIEDKKLGVWSELSKEEREEIEIKRKDRKGEGRKKMIVGEE